MDVGDSRAEKELQIGMKLSELNALSKNTENDLVEDFIYLYTYQI